MHQSLIIQHLFQVNSLEDVSRERLETFVGDHPSFGIGHYLLSRKLQKEDTVGFEEKTQLTCLYFSNPFWLQWLLENTDVGGQKAAPAIIQEEATAAVHEETTPVIYEETTAVIHEEAAPVIHEEAATGVMHHAEEPAVDPATEEMPHVENVVTMAEEAFHEESAAAPVIAAGAGVEEGHSAAEQLLRSIEQARELRESLQKINTNFADEPAVNGEELAPIAAAETAEVSTEPAAAVAEPIAVSTEPAAAVTDAVVVDEPVHEEMPIRDEEVPFVLDETEETRLAAEAQIEAAQEQVAAAAEPIIAHHEPIIAHQEPTVTHREPVVAHHPIATPDIVFEPLHTIDYFASQGIKFNLEENPADALGKQLKSFTDWLKTMRRLPQKNKEMIPDRLTEQAIQNFAAHSIEGKEVLTEAMAEVLAKQGMKQRARAVYEKLSLLNPEKSAYFAAKIEQLNIL